MGIELLPDYIRTNYEVIECKHSCAILKYDFPSEWEDIIDVLMKFRLKEAWIREGGGSKSKVSICLDSYLAKRGWGEKAFDTSIKIDDSLVSSPTHKIDCYKNRIALEIEWNNKDPFYDRDLNNFRLLFDLRAISVGVIITRATELHEIFNDLGIGKSYGASTTHLNKLRPRINGGSSGGCPLLVFGIKKSLFDKTIA